MNINKTCFCCLKNQSLGYGLRSANSKTFTSTNRYIMLGQWYTHLTHPIPIPSKKMQVTWDKLSKQFYSMEKDWLVHGWIFGKNGKSPFYVGNTSSNGPFPVATLVSPSVTILITTLAFNFVDLKSTHHSKDSPGFYVPSKP